MASRRRIKLINVNDFTGGVRLGSNPEQLEDNESPDLLNVDVGARGGVRQRRGVVAWADALPGQADRLMSFYTDGGTRQVLASAGGELLSSTGGGWVKVADRAPDRGVSFKGHLYLTNLSDGGAKWNGSGFGTLADPADGGWNNDYDMPSGGRLPAASCIAVYMGCLFVAGTNEDGTDYPSRVRFSHFNQPEDWSDTDFIDIDTGADGDRITALVPTGDRLLVFKEHSVHVIYGEPPDGLSTFPLTRAVGTISQESCVASDAGVYFVDWPQGLFLVAGNEIQWKSERVWDAFNGGSVPFVGSETISVGWGNRRVWVSVPWEGGERRCLILDPELSRKGSWVIYDLDVGPFLTFDPPGASVPLFLAADRQRPRVLRLDVNGQTFDNFGDGDVRISSYYMTRWFDDGEPAVIKRWRRPEFVLLDTGQAELPVEVYTQWDPTEYRKSFRIVTDVEGDVLVWDEGVWDGAVWAPSAGERNALKRGSSLGTANAVALKIHGPLATNTDWAMNALVLKMIPRKVRS